MPIFKYTVANKEGKKLSGTVEAPDEQIARTELNNLGFSILSFQETKEVPKVDPKLTKFIFEAIDKNSKLITGSIPSKTQEDAFKKLSTEYALTVTAIWEQGASGEEIENARKKGPQFLQEELTKEIEKSQEKNLEQQKEEQFLKNKIETIISQVTQLLKDLDKELDPNTKKEISKRINKLLRIKQSKNLNYILSTAENLLEFMEDQEKELKEKGYQEKRLELQMKTKKLLNELHESSKPKTLSEDILRKIENWEDVHKKEKKGEIAVKFITRFLEKIKKIFQTPEELKVIKNQIKIYNKQLWEFAKLYIKEPTKEYKAKVKESLKTIWKARKKAKHSLKYAKQILKKREKIQKTETHLVLSFIEEMNSLTGWLLAFYLVYYLISLYITTKNFSLPIIPQGFYVYESQLFKYVLVILFLLHATTSLKVNFFRKSLIASIILVPVFIFGTIVILLNF